MYTHIVYFKNNSLIIVYIKKTNILQAIIHYSHIVCLISQKINMITTEVRMVWKTFLCEDLREYAIEINNYEKKEMPPLTKEERKSIL